MADIVVGSIHAREVNAVFGVFMPGHRWPVGGVWRMVSVWDGTHFGAADPDGSKGDHHVQPTLSRDKRTRCVRGLAGR